MQHSIFQIDDIDYHLIQNCPIKTIVKLSTINKYYYHVTHDRLFPYRECFNRSITFTEWPNARVFLIACLYGNIDIINFIRNETNINFNDAINTGFQLACSHNNLPIAKYIFNTFKIDIHNDNDYAFRWSCKNHCFDIIKWMFDEINFPVNNLSFDMIKLLFINTKLDIKHIDKKNNWIINFSYCSFWSDVFLYQVIIRNFEVAEYIGKNMFINIKLIYKIIITYIDYYIDINCNDDIDNSINTIIENFRSNNVDIHELKMHLLRKN